MATVHATFIEDSHFPRLLSEVCSVRQLRPDLKASLALSEASAPTEEIWQAGVVYTQCAHIAPESTYLNEDSSNEEVCGRLFLYTTDDTNRLILLSSLQCWPS